MRRFTGRQVGGFFIILLGLGIIGSGLIRNPWTTRWMGGPASVDRLDVTASYFVWAIVLGAAMVGLGILFERSRRLDGFVILFLFATAVVLSDRYMLAKLGLPLWEHDVELRYRHRPGVTRLVDPHGPLDRVHTINGWGLHDIEFPEKKPPRELRGLMLGDSVTMGYGVTYDETFSTQLEEILSENDRQHEAHQIINAGVHGYATRQERIVLQRSLRFEPDFIALGFCMNDVVEPFVVDEELGGTGLDYHSVSQTPSPAVGWILNETGYGRFLQQLQARGKTLEAEKRLEIFNVQSMSVRSRTDPRFVEAWKLVKTELEKIYAIADRENKPFVLLIFPYTFQLLGDDPLRTPQALLKEHAKAHGQSYIDFTPILREAIYDDSELVTVMRARGYDDEAIQSFYARKVDEYFFDEDHFREPGHRLVAEHLYRWLSTRGLVTKATTTTVAGTP